MEACLLARQIEPHVSSCKSISAYMYMYQVIHVLNAHILLSTNFWTIDFVIRVSVWGCSVPALKPLCSNEGRIASLQDVRDSFMLCVLPAVYSMSR